MTEVASTSRGWFAATLLLLAADVSVAAKPDPYAAARQELIRAIAADVRDTSQYLNKRELDERVLRAMEKLPRHEFVLSGDRAAAYENRPLPIGHGQTISQPYIVAVMTDLVEPTPTCRALEVGTGSGYQAAILAELCDEVYTIEIVDELGTTARDRLARLGYRNVTVRVGDGYYGWQQHAPFDVIVVTAVASHVPPSLLRQMKPGGRMILPVGTRFTAQQLILVQKHGDGRITTRQILPVQFVPLTGGHE
jgi:protein-L-isoaspartate(D-aspartate) O-methyltransferase